MSYGAIKKFLEEVEVICLRCGECCHAWEVRNVPDYERGIKPERQRCQHCHPAVMDEQSQWHLTTCLIHVQPDYPKECRDFKMPSFLIGRSPCCMGIAIWKMRLEQFPDSKLPEEVEKFIELEASGD